MTPEQMSELFQPFNHLGRERSQQEERASAWSSASGLAELMADTLRALSVPGEGSSFIWRCRPSRAAFDSFHYTGLQTSTAEYHRRIVHTSRQQTTSR